MDWIGDGQVFGYTGTACFLYNAGLISWRQRTSALYWVIVFLGNALWLACGWKLQSPAVIVDVLAFLPIHVWGTWRYWAGRRVRMDV